MGLKVTLAGQDVTKWVDELSIDIEGNLGQGPGIAAGSSGRATTCTFLTQMGPAASAIGAAESIPAAVYKAAILADGPVAYYRLTDPSTSTTIADTTGLNGNGTPASGTPLLGVLPGPVGGKSCSTIAGAQWSIPWNSLPTGNHALTLESWCWWVPNGAHQAAMSLGNDVADEEIWLGLDSTGHPVLQTVTATAVLTAADAVTPNAWHYLVGVYTGSDLRLYVDGQLMGTLSYSSLNLVNGAAGLGVERSIGNHWAGNLGECAFYATDLSETQVQTHYAARAALPALVRQGDLVIYDASGNVVFGGYVSDLQDKTSYTVIKTKVTCSDYWQDMARIVVNQIYASEYDDDIVSNLLSTYDPTLDTSSWTPSHSYLFTKIYLRSQTLQQSLQQIADIVGFDVWVDPYGKFHYQSPSSEGNAPFSLSDHPDFSTSFPYTVQKYEQDDTAIINRVYFYGGKTPTDDFTQDLSAQIDGTNDTFVLAYYPREASDGKVHVYVNGVEKALGAVLTSGAANTLKSDGGTADVLLDRSAQALTFDSSEIPQPGQTVTCKYRYMVPITLVMTNAASFKKFGRYFDGVISDTTVQDKETAIQRCKILLQEQALGLTHITVQFYQAGLQPGTVLRLDHDIRDIHDSFIVQTVKVTPLGNGQFEYTADLGSWNWNLVDLIIDGGRRGQLIDQLDDESDETVQASENDFTLTMTVTVTSVTHTAGQFYARSSPVGDGHDAYPGLSTITS